MPDHPLENSLYDDLSVEARFAQENGKLIAALRAAYQALDTSTPQVKKNGSVQSALAILADAGKVAPKIVISPKASKKR